MLNVLSAHRVLAFLCTVLRSDCLGKRGSVSIAADSRIGAVRRRVSQVVLGEVCQYAGMI